jgi:hypothetical protein
MSTIMNPNLAVEDAKSSVDVFELPCGYVDENGMVHTSVTVREMTGEDEETLAARNMPTAKKFNRILSRCTESNPDKIAQIIPELTQGDRIYLLLSIRRVSLGDEMPFETPCPSCKQVGRFHIDLGDLESKKMTNPSIRNYDLILPKSKKKVRMQVLTGRGEEAISKAAVRGSDVISTAILARIESIDDKPAIIQDLKNLPLMDRNFLRDSWESHEGGVDTEIDVECPSCGHSYETELDISQAGFFNPLAALKSWKTKYSL